MKLSSMALLFTASIIAFSGCNGVSPTPSGVTKIDKTLPTIQLTKNGTIADMNAIAFEWKPIADPRVEGIYIYKAGISSSKTKRELYKNIKNRFTTHYLDTDVKPNHSYSYSFKTYSKDGESYSSKPILVSTLPVLDSVSWIYAVTGMPRTAKILWRPHPNQKVKSYIIERETLEDNEWEKLATVNGRLNVEYIDTDLKDGYVYKYRIRVVTFDGITSAPSSVVKVITKPLPKEVENINATRNLPKKIKITWDKSKDKDFARYYVYRSTSADGSYDLIAKLYNNVFVDKVKEDGAQYFYRVSVVDKDGLESRHDKYSIQGIALAKPTPPAIVEAKLLNGKIELSWSRVDERTKSYIVSRRYKQGWFDEVKDEFKNIKGTKFEDKNLVADAKYYYTIYAVDKNNIISEPSVEVMVKTPEAPKVSVQKTTTQQTKKQNPSDTTDVEVIAPTDDLGINEL